MRIAITGASGNFGTALLRRLQEHGGFEVRAIARRLPPPGAQPYDRADWTSCDVGAEGATGRLAEVFDGVDAVVHLAWQIQPTHNPHALRRTNIAGSQAVLDAVVRAGVPTLIHASSVGAYASAPRTTEVDEGWPTTGVQRSSYSRDKVDVERRLDRLQADQPGLRVVRLRPAFILQRDAAAEARRYFFGPLAPMSLLRSGRLPVPSASGWRFQVVHADDVAEACVQALIRDVNGAFNLAATPALTPELIAEVVRGWSLRVPKVLMRAVAAATWTLRLQPVDAGWVRLGLGVPVMRTHRAADHLGWQPSTDARATLLGLLDGLAEHAHTESPPLSGGRALPGRLGGLLRGRLPGTGDPY